MGGQKIAIFNLGGHYYAIENTCPHRGGPLAEGMVAGDEVICPWHGSRFKHQNRCRPESTGPRGREELCSSVTEHDVEVEIGQGWVFWSEGILKLKPSNRVSAGFQRRKKKGGA